MLRLFVLLTAVVCCNACRLEMFPTQDSTSSPPGCADSDGNLHDFFSEWENGPETCVCVDFGTICCERYGHWGPTDYDYIQVTTEQYVPDESNAQTADDYDVAEETNPEK